jgi:serine phosphatase RsbU (regulator of sigma subunit)
VKTESNKIAEAMHRIGLRAREGAEALAGGIASAARGSGIGSMGQRIPDPPLVDPVRFKGLLILAIKILLVVELASAFLEGIKGQGWGRFGVDLMVAGILWLMWERITRLVREEKEVSRRRMESGGENIRVWDALVFSLLWSDEIYMEIPTDRRRFVVIAYTLITLGVVAAFIKIGSGLMPLVIVAVLVLAAVNLLVWVVSLERGEKETLQTELRLARQVQESLMPKASPSPPGFDIAGYALPAREVGGDQYDYCWLGSAAVALGISVSDVSGKGMQAAMAAVFTSGAFAGDARTSTSPAEILTRLNRSVYAHSRRGQFVAFLLAVLDTERKTLTFANAGQVKPLLLRDGKSEWLESVGIHFPLGMKEDSLYAERTVELGPGDVVLLLTDGFTDAMNASREQFGPERLQRLLEQPGCSGRTAREILEVVVQNVRAHTAGSPQHDDMTMVVLRRT